jgi:hypothetical protein
MCPTEIFVRIKIRFPSVHHLKSVGQAHQSSFVTVQHLGQLVDDTQLIIETLHIASPHFSMEPLL